MEFTITSPAVLFPAISLLFLAYTNRFLHLAALVRSLHSDWLRGHDPLVLAQVSNLKKRIVLIRWCQAFGVISLIICLASMLALLISFPSVSIILFGFSVIVMLLSLLSSLWEIMISGGALNLFLNQMEQTNSSNSTERHKIP